MDPVVSTSVTVSISASLSGDAETLTLAETGAGTGVFEGSIELSIAAPVPDGRLQTSRDVSQVPVRFDTLTATYGAPSDTADMIGSTVEILDTAGNPVETFFLGDTIRFRVVDVLRNQSTTMVDQISVTVYPTAVDYQELEVVTLTETGPDTSVFEGSIPTTRRSSYIPTDGLLELEPGDRALARHDDANGETSSSDTAKGLLDLPLAIEWVDDPGQQPLSLQPLSQAFEFSSARLRVTDVGLAGLGSIYVRVTSDLRGDEEWVELRNAAPYNAGVFIGSVRLPATPASSPPPTQDGELEVTEIAGPPLQRDTIRAFHEGCSAPPCPSDAVEVIGSRTRLTDSSFRDVDLVAPGVPILIEVIDHSVAATSPTTASVESQAGDFEVVSLETTSVSGAFGGSIAVEVGLAVQGDGVLQVQEADTITARHPDPLGYSSSTDTATVATGQLEFLDRSGNPVDYVLVDGPIRVRAAYPPGNANPSAADTVTATVRSRQFNGIVRDTESLQLVETGANTAVFTGAMPSSAHYWVQVYDGVLQVWVTDGQSDTVEVELESTTVTAPLISAILRIVDASGTDVTLVPEGGTVYLRVEADDVNDDPLYPDSFQVQVRSLTTGDEEYVNVEETGPNTSFFEGSISTVIAASPVPGNGQIEVQDGETIQASNNHFFGAAVDLVVVGDGIPNGDPPNAVDDAATTPDDTPVAINVLSNDSDPDGHAIGVVSFTQGAQRGAVSDSGGGVLTYTPPPYFTGTDTFTYQIRDELGEEDSAMVTVTIEFVNDPPVANDDAYSLYEDRTATFVPEFNDRDPENQRLTVIAVTQGSKGTVAIGYDFVSYTPQPNANGSDSFTYTIADPQGATASATVRLTIRPLADLPVAVDDAATVAEDTAVLIYVRDNDSDPDGDAILISNVTQGANGSVSHDSMKVSYQPAANFNGTDSFTYTINDGNGLTATATVTVTVTGINDNPIAVEDSGTTAEDSAVTVGVLINDNDLEGDSLSITAVTQGANGSVTFTAGSVTYTPAADFNGSDSFAYTVSDGNGGTATATVIVTVTPADDAPVAVADAVATDEDVSALIFATLNDSDPDGDSLEVSEVTQPANGTAVIDTGLYIRYTPNADFHGADQFSYQVTDSTGLSSTAQVTVTINPVADPPEAAGDAATTNEDTAVAISILANDRDGDGDTLSISSVTQPSFGSVSINAGGTVTYAPAANYNGSDTFTYTISDGNGGSSSARVDVIVAAVNDPPVAADDSANLDEDTYVAIAVLNNDSDVDGGPVTRSVIAVTQGVHGTVAINPDSTVTYAPQANYNGPDSFTYTVSDGIDTDTASVTVTVNPRNDAPVAADDSATTNEDTAVTASVLANDSDLDGDNLSITAVTQGTNGSVTFTVGSVTYTPASNFNGSDAFTYTISDGNGGTATGSVSIIVSATNDAPAAANDSGTTAEDSPVTISVLTNDSDLDGDSLSVTAVTQGANGSVTFDANSVTYTPASNFNGSDAFTYTIGDGNGGTATATVSITINATNDAPTAANDSGTTAEDSAIAISVLTNDSDLEGDSLSVTAVTQGVNGSITFTAGSVTYTPAANFNGSDSFTYTISDGNGGTATATVSITINAANDAPDAVNDTAATNEDTVVTISILANDSDVDGEVVILLCVTQGTRGSVVQNANGTVTYTPNPNTFGADAFSYTARDAAGLTDSATVTVNVIPVNDPPDAINDSATTDEGSSVTITAIANDTDIEGDALTVIAVSTPAHGTATINGNGTVTYSPASTYSGSDSFTYTISDGSATDSATVTIQIKDVIGNVAVLGTHSVWIQTGADVLSGDVIANAAGSAPFLNSTELSIAGGATTAAGWDVQGNRVTIASGAVVASDVY
ncbi:MAG TPA: Ig-like domain-containing protein, partial [Thermoanaerobaculia bacterium]|nr:Ig-like domain-containing protein [Thermoanaerobaculia bacterium]